MHLQLGSSFFQGHASQSQPRRLKSPQRRQKLAFIWSDIHWSNIDWSDFATNSLHMIMALWVELAVYMVESVRCVCVCVHVFLWLCVHVLVSAW